MFDTIVSPGEEIKPEKKEKAKQIAGASDLMIAMGTNMDDTVYLPSDGRFVLINTKPGRLDQFTSLILRARADKVMDLLLEKLTFPKLQWKRCYRLRVSLLEKTNTIKCSTIDHFSRQA